MLDDLTDREKILIYNLIWNEVTVNNTRDRPEESKELGLVLKKVGLLGCNLTVA